MRVFCVVCHGQLSVALDAAAFLLVCHAQNVATLFN